MVKILLVDDDEGFIDLVKTWDIEAEIITFNFVSDALLQLPTISPDIVITDVMMPGVHGLDFCRSRKI